MTAAMPPKIKQEEVEPGLVQPRRHLEEVSAIRPDTVTEHNPRTVWSRWNRPARKGNAIGRLEPDRLRRQVERVRGNDEGGSRQHGVTKKEDRGEEPRPENRQEDNFEHDVTSPCYRPGSVARG